MGEDYEKIWQEIEEKAQTSIELGIYKRRLASKSPFHIFIGYARDENRRVILFPISDSNIPNEREFPKSKGLIFEIKKLLLDQKVWKTITIKIKDKSFSDIFTSLIYDIIKNLPVNAQEDDFVKYILNRIKKWQRFLDKYSRDGLSLENQIGLFGELYFLSEYLFPVFDIDLSLDMWQGPYGKPQDIQYKNWAIEIKTTLKGDHKKLFINNLQQLNFKNFKDGLYLVSFTLIRKLNIEKTLNFLVKSIYFKIGENFPAKNKFEELLHELGYLERHEKFYDKFGYDVGEIRIYRVNKDFPRLSIDLLPNGIGDVSYSILLSICDQWKLNNQNFKEMLLELKKNKNL